MDFSTLKNTLGKYSRDNKYVNALSEAFDSYVEYGIDTTEEILDFLDSTSPFLEHENVPQSTQGWKDAFAENNEKNKKIICLRFTQMVNKQHAQYRIFLRRFVEEHLRDKEAISITLQNQLLFIDDILRRLDLDYFEAEETEFCEVLNNFRSLYTELLSQLVDKIKSDYKMYITNPANPVEPYPLEGDEEIDDMTSFSTVASKVLLLSELGVIEFLTETYPSLEKKQTYLAKILTKFMSENCDTIRRVVCDMKSNGKNSPYRNKRKMSEVESLFKLFNIKK